MLCFPIKKINGCVCARQSNQDSGSSSHLGTSSRNNTMSSRCRSANQIISLISATALRTWQKKDATPPLYMVVLITFTHFTLCFAHASALPSSAPKVALLTLSDHLLTPRRSSRLCFVALLFPVRQLPQVACPVRPAMHGFNEWKERKLRSMRPMRRPPYPCTLYLVVSSF